MVDDSDIQIIEQLRKEGRLSLRKLAERVDISASTVSNRFNQLVKNKVIKGFKPVLNYEKLGFGLTTIIQLTTESGKMDSVVEELKEVSYIESVYVVTGDTDAVVICRFKDRQDMNKGARNLQDIDGVEGTKTNVVLESEENLDIEL
ncbi:MAG: DNA-binding Lrp family transcriptional regulator [Candidatus Nanohaloarchaea archaeon]|jgi:DNA-binding Lrp family transcriptional regulator